MAILTVTSPIVIDVPTRDLLLIVTKGSFVLWWANLNNKTNCSSMFVNSEYCYYAVLQWQTPLRFSQLLFYCQVYARRTICLFVLSVYVCENSESSVLNNGFCTNYSKLSRGVRQGCLLSPYLFILAAEVLTTKIRQDKTVRGITIFVQSPK